MEVVVGNFPGRVFVEGHIIRQRFMVGRQKLRLEFERRRIESVRVVPRFTGAGKNGYVVAQYQVLPAEVQVAGPASHVARIGQVVTDPVDVSGVTGTAQFRVNTYVNDPYVRILSQPQVTVTVTMKKL